MLTRFAQEIRCAHEEEEGGVERQQVAKAFSEDRERSVDDRAHEGAIAWIVSQASAVDLEPV